MGTVACVVHLLLSLVAIEHSHSSSQGQFKQRARRTLTVGGLYSVSILAVKGLLATLRTDCSQPPILYV
jgi:hypothetical protein